MERKQERKEKGKKRVEEISQDERKKIREEERIGNGKKRWNKDNNILIYYI